MAEAMTLEQQKALAMASARLRAQEAESEKSNPAEESRQINYGVELEKQMIDEMSPPERVFKSLGAGFADIPLSVKQMLSTDDAETQQLESEAADKREVDKYLSKKTDTGFLPDQVYGIDTPTVSSLAQFYGKTVPTMVLPASRLAGLKGVLNNIVVGTGLSALEPTVGGESRGMNMAMGGALSGILPGAASGVKGVYNMATQGGGRARAGKAAAKVLTENGGNEAKVLRQTIDRLRNASQQNKNQNIPLSTAAQLRDPDLARLEAGSRTISGANWYDFDQNQAKALSDAVKKATNSADDLGPRRALRQSNFSKNKNQATATVNEDVFNSEMTGLRTNLESAMRSPESSNPAVRNMLKEIGNEMDRLGPDFNMQHLATIRHNLSGKAALNPQTAYQAAPRESTATISLLQNVDNILNNSTNQRWQDVVSGYARDSNSVRAAQAAGKVREAYFDNTGRVRKISADIDGDTPLITQSNLGSAMDSARGPTKNVLLSNEANMRLNSVLGALRQQDLVKGVKRSATGGGGSNTAGDTAAAKSASAFADAATNMTGGPAASIGKGVINALRDFANQNKDKALAEALQNPKQMINLLEAKIASNSPMTVQEQYLYSLLRGVPAAATN